MFFKPEIYFIDLDGTTLDLPKKSQKISDKNLNAIKKMNETTPIVFSTGRSNSEFVMNLAKQTNCKYVICQNGGLIVDINNNILKKYEIQKDDVYEIEQLLKKEKMLFILNSGHTIYGTTAKLRFISIWARNMEKKSYDEIPRATNATKILTFGKTKKGIRMLRDLLLEKFINIAVHIVSKGYALEITNQNATKGEGDLFICKLLDIDPKKTVHIGDSGNDVVTKSYVGAFVAMGNAVKDIKKQATEVGPKFKRSGLAKLFNKIQESN